MIHLYYTGARKGQGAKDREQRIEMKLYHVVLGLLLVVVFCIPVAAQEGLTDGERIARLEGAYEHLATKVDVEGVRTEVVALRSEVHAAAQTTRVIFSAIAGFLALVLGGAQVWIGLILRERKHSVAEE